MKVNRAPEGIRNYVSNVYVIVFAYVRSVGDLVPFFWESNAECSRVVL